MKTTLILLESWKWKIKLYIYNLKEASERERERERVLKNNSTIRSPLLSNGIQMMMIGWYGSTC